jgi:AhpD family alkylhydroperoxidase
MGKDHKEQARCVNEAAATLRRAVPDVMAAFGGLGAAARQDGALDHKTKELITLVIAVSKRCDACIAYHAKQSLKLGVTREEVAEAVAVAVHMGGGPAMVYAGQALAAYDEFAAVEEERRERELQPA